MGCDWGWPTWVEVQYAYKRSEKESNGEGHLLCLIKHLKGAAKRVVNTLPMEIN